MATYDLKYPGAAIDAILDTAYDLQNAGYIFRGLASEYSNTPTERSWVLAGEGETGHGFTSPIPKGYIGVCVFNGTSWTGKLLKCVSIDSTPTSGSTNALSSGGAYTSISQLATTVNEALDNLTFTDSTPSAFLGEYITEKVSTTDDGIERILTYFTILSATASKAGLLSAADKAKLDAILSNLRSLEIDDTTAYADLGDKIVESIKATIGGTEETISTFQLLAATASKAGLLSAADKAKLDALWSSGYQFAGIATPSTTPVSTTSKIFYIATEAGTYFNAVTITQGINILSWDGTSWSAVQVIGIDDEPLQNSTNIAGSGGVYDSIGKKTFVLTFDGKGNSLSKGALSTALIAGHKYRFTIKNTSWSVEGITHTSSLYDKFAIIAYNNSEYSSEGSGDVKITIPDPPVKMPEDVLPYYETILPTEVDNISVKEWWVCADGRAAEGTEVVVVVEDVTIQEMNRRRDIARLLQAGVPVPLNYQDIVYLFEKVTQWDDHLMCVYYDNEGGIYGTENADWWSHRGDQEGAETYRIPLAGYSAVDLYEFSTTFLYGSLITDSEGKALYGITHNAKQYNRWKRQFVAGDMAYLLYTVAAPSLRTQEKLLVLYPPKYDFTNRAKDIGSTLSVTEPESAGGQVMEIGFNSRAITENQLPVGTDFIEYMGTVEIPRPASKTLRKVYNIMRIGGYSTVTINAARTSENQPCGVFLDANMEVIARYINPVGSGLQLSISVPSTAVYFVYIFYLAENLPYSLEAKVKTPKNIGTEIKSISDCVALVQGNVDELTGEIVQSNLYVSSTPISGGKGFFLKTNRGYEVHAAHLYDLEGNMVAYNYLPPKEYNSMPYTFFFEDGLRTFYGSCAIPAGYILVVVFTKYANSVQQEIVNTDNVIGEFCYLNDGRISNMSHSTANWRYALEKIRQLSCIAWIPELDVFAAVPSDSQGDYFFKAGRKRFGIPYSEASEYSKYVGQHVSLYTFMTAILNRRSVMYTERINGSGSSEYGFTYHGLASRYASSFYGTVCTGLTGYVLGYKNVYISDNYEEGYAPGLTRVSNASADNVMPLDIIWNDGHCSVIEDILFDEYGDRKYIIWAEQTKPTEYITPFTPEMFNKRLDVAQCKVYRYSGWEETEPSPATPFIQTKWWDYPKNFVGNTDICTMYGDKPCLCVGDTIWLNYIKTKGYTGIVIEKKNGDEWEVYDTITLAGDEHVREIAADEVYNDYNLNDEDLQAGMYRAKMIGDNSQESDYTYWEMIDISLSVTTTTSGIDVVFSSSSGTPYLIRNEKASGFMEVYHRDHQITAQEVEDGEVSLSWKYSTTYPGSYIKVFVEGEYGVAVKKVLFPND